MSLSHEANASISSRRRRCSAASEADQAVSSFIDVDVHFDNPICCYGLELSFGLQLVDKIVHRSSCKMEQNCLLRLLKTPEIQTTNRVPEKTA